METHNKILEYNFFLMSVSVRNRELLQTQQQTVGNTTDDPVSESVSKTTPSTARTAKEAAKTTQHQFESFSASL